MTESREEVEGDGRFISKTECRINRLVEIVEELAEGLRGLSVRLNSHINNHDIIITEEEMFEATEAGKEVVCSKSETTTQEPTEEELVGKICYCWDKDTEKYCIDRITEYCKHDLFQYKAHKSVWACARIVPKDELLEMQGYEDEEEFCEWTLQKPWGYYSGCCGGILWEKFTYCPDCGKKVKEKKNE